MFFYGVAFAAPSMPVQSESMIAGCNQFRQQMRQNHQAIDAAFDKKDACTMGKLMIENRQIFESHPECFPKRNKMMQGSIQPTPMAK